MADNSQLKIGPDKTLLLVDDDQPFLRRLAKAMIKAGSRSKLRVLLLRAAPFQLPVHRPMQLLICVSRMATVWMWLKCRAKNVPIVGLWF